MLFPHIKRELLRIRATSDRVQSRKVGPSLDQIQAVRTMAATDAAADACLLVRELLNKRYHELISGDEFDRIEAAGLKDFSSSIDIQHIIDCCLENQKEH